MGGSASSGAFLTSLYMGRLCWYTFAGTYRGGAPDAAAHGHGSDQSGAGHGGSGHGAGAHDGGGPHENPRV